MSRKNEIEIYIHIPFCVKKCAYCDFLSFPADEAARKRYVDALLEETKKRAAPSKGKRVRSIYIGGGTPSVLFGEQIKKILDFANRYFDVKKDAEISMEANPESLTEAKLDAYLSAGVNRLSIGCQSTDEKELSVLGRPHGFDDFLRAYERAKSCGFVNINADMIYGLPYQSADKWREELEAVARLDIRHLSAYNLILEEGTRLYDVRDSYAFPDDDESARMFEITDEVLRAHGFFRYEISNHAKTGFECIHNIGYWRGVPYLGLGLGASSFDGDTRFSNTRSFEEYLECRGDARKKEDDWSLSVRDRYSEYVILGLRLTEGISASGFYDEFGRDIFEVFGESLTAHINKGTIRASGDRLFIPEKYLFVSNRILADFL